MTEEGNRRSVKYGICPCMFRTFPLPPPGRAGIIQAWPEAHGEPGPWETGPVCRKSNRFLATACSPACPEGPRTRENAMVSPDKRCQRCGTNDGTVEEARIWGRCSRAR